MDLEPLAQRQLETLRGRESGLSFEPVLDPANDVLEPPAKGEEHKVASYPPGGPDAEACYFIAFPPIGGERILKSPCRLD